MLESILSELRLSLQRPKVRQTTDRPSTRNGYESAAGSFCVWGLDEIDDRIVRSAYLHEMLRSHCRDPGPDRG